VIKSPHAGRRLRSTPPEAPRVRPARGHQGPEKSAADPRKSSYGRAQDSDFTMPTRTGGQDGAVKVGRAIVGTISVRARKNRSSPHRNQGSKWAPSAARRKDLSEKVRAAVVGKANPRGQSFSKPHQWRLSQQSGTAPKSWFQVMAKKPATLGIMLNHTKRKKIQARKNKPCEQQARGKQGIGEQ